MTSIIEITKEPIDFKSRWLDTIKEIVVILSSSIVAPLVISIITSSEFLLIIISAVFAFNLLLNIILIRRKCLYFVTQAQLTESELSIAFLQKDNPNEKIIPVSELDILLNSRSRSLKLRIKHHSNLVAIQSQYATWSNEEIWQLYTAVQQLKKYPLNQA